MHSRNRTRISHRLYPARPSTGGPEGQGSGPRRGKGRGAFLMALYGAVLSTVLAVFAVLSFVNSRPVLDVEATGHDYGIDIGIRNRRCPTRIEAIGLQHYDEGGCWCCGESLLWEFNKTGDADSDPVAPPERMDSGSVWCGTYLCADASYLRYAESWEAPDLWREYRMEKDQKVAHYKRGRVEIEVRHSMNSRPSAATVRWLSYTESQCERPTALTYEDNEMFCPKPAREGE